MNNNSLNYFRKAVGKMSELILETRDLSKAYGKKMAVNHMNLQIEKGKLLLKCVMELYSLQEENY